MGPKNQTRCTDGAFTNQYDLLRGSIDGAQFFNNLLISVTPFGDLSLKVVRLFSQDPMIFRKDQLFMLQRWCYQLLPCKVFERQVGMEARRRRIRMNVNRLYYPTQTDHQRGYPIGWPPKVQKVIRSFADKSWVRYTLCSFWIFHCPSSLAWGLCVELINKVNE